MLNAIEKVRQHRVVIVAIYNSLGGVSYEVRCPRCGWTLTTIHGEATLQYRVAVAEEYYALHRHECEVGEQ